MTTVRLPEDVEQKLEYLSQERNTTKTELIKEALEGYFYKQEEEKDSWEIGEPSFGKYGSGDGSLSTTYKKRIKEKLNVRRSR